MGESEDIQETELPPIVRFFGSGDSARVGIRMGPARSGQQRRMMQFEDRKGYKVQGNRVTVWKWNGTVEEDGYLYAVLSLTGSLGTLDEIEHTEPEKAVRLGEHYLNAYQTLKNSFEEAASRIGPQAAFFESEEIWYFLPPSLAALREEETLKKSGGGRLDTEEKISRELLTHLYISITGADPYSIDTSVAAHPYIFRPELGEKCAELLFRPFTNFPLPRTEELIGGLEYCRSEGITERVGDDEQARIRKKAEEELKRQVRKNRLREKIRKFGPPVGIAAATILVLLVFFLPTGKKGEDPTNGLGAKELIRLYYESMNTLDHEAMSACTLGRAGRHHINEVTTLFVVARVRKGVEHTDSFMNAEKWEKNNRPPLSDYTFVYGVSELDIRREGRENETSEIFTVEYRKYSTLPKEIEENKKRTRSTGIVEISRVVEELKLEQQEDEDWKIARITPTKKEQLEQVFSKEGE